MKGKFNRLFSKNVCDTLKPFERRKKKISVTLDAACEEKLAVLAAFSGGSLNVSGIVNGAVLNYLQLPEMSQKLAEAYALWKKQS